MDSIGSSFDNIVDFFVSSLYGWMILSWWSSANTDGLSQRSISYTYDVSNWYKPITNSEAPSPAVCTSVWPISTVMSVVIASASYYVIRSSWLGALASDLRDMANYCVQSYYLCSTYTSLMWLHSTRELVIEIRDMLKTNANIIRSHMLSYYIVFTTTINP